MLMILIFLRNYVPNNVCCNHGLSITFVFAYVHNFEIDLKFLDVVKQKLMHW